MFRLEIGGSNKCDQDFLFVVCRDGPLTFNHDYSGLYEGSLANLGEIEVFQVQVQGKRKAHLGHLCKGVCS